MGNVLNIFGAETVAVNKKNITETVYTRANVTRDDANAPTNYSAGIELSFSDLDGSHGKMAFILKDHNGVTKVELQQKIHQPTHAKVFIVFNGEAYAETIFGGNLWVQVPYDMFSGRGSGDADSQIIIEAGGDYSSFIARAAAVFAREGYGASAYSYAMSYKLDGGGSFDWEIPFEMIPAA